MGNTGDTEGSQNNKKKKKPKNAWRLSILSEDKIRVEAEGGGLPHLQPPQRAQGK